MEVKYGTWKKVKWEFYEGERSMMRAVYGVQLKDGKRSKDLMLMLGLDEAIDQLAMTDSVHWHGHVLRREDGHVLRSFEVESQRGHGGSELKKKVWRLVWDGKMRIADQSGVLVWMRLLPGWGISGHPHLLGILPDIASPSSLPTHCMQLKPHPLAFLTNRTPVINHFNNFFLKYFPVLIYQQTYPSSFVCPFHYSHFIYVCHHQYIFLFSFINRLILLPVYVLFTTFLILILSMSATTSIFSNPWGCLHSLWKLSVFFSYQ